MRVAIAGATGLIGSAVAARLQSLGHELVRIGRGADAQVRADLATIERFAPGALAGCDALVHAAGVTDEDSADPRRAAAKAGRGAQALLGAARAAGIRNLAYFSSAHVYGPLQGRIDESHALDPRSEYARLHAATERAFAAAGDDARVLILRPCAVYGMPPSLERFARWSLIPFDFPRQALGGRIVLKSAGLQRRNFVSSEALGDLTGRWLGQSQAGVGFANAPGRDETSVYDFAMLCARIAREELASECAVERPVGAASAAPPLEYSTIGEPATGGPTLEEHTRALLRALSRKNPP